MIKFSIDPTFSCMEVEHDLGKGVEIEIFEDGIVTIGLECDWGSSFVDISFEDLHLLATMAETFKERRMIERDKPDDI